MGKTLNESSRKRCYIKRITRIKKITGEDQKVFALDVGCEDGMFLELIRDYSVFLKGVDSSGTNVKKAKARLGERAEILHRDYLEVPVELNKYDLICMWEILGKIVNPNEYIKKAAGELRNDGFLCISVDTRLITKKSLLDILKINGLTMVNAHYTYIYTSIRDLIRFRLYTDLFVIAQKV